jgi:glutathione synthase/RimK-type ligase-like ATP-grasp enzyme
VSETTVLVLGCSSTTPHGRDQMRRVSEQARHRGLRLLGADTQANLRAAAPELVDEIVQFDVHDPDAARVWATGRVNVDAVLTFREMCVESVAAVADELGLAGNDPAAVRTVRNKDLCREALRAAGFRQPLCTVVTDEESARRFLVETAQGPWIVKPRDAMGSTGVSLVEGPESLAAAIEKLAPDAPFIVETFVRGPEFSAEGVLLGGVPVVLALTAKSTGAGFVETGHRTPAALDDAAASAARTEVERALRTVGITRGVFHAEFWVDGNGVVLGEIHVRPGGDFIHAMVEHSRPGLELYGTLVDDLLGNASAPMPEQTAAAGAEFLLLPVGEVRDVQGWTEVCADPSVIAADLTVRPGDRIGQVRGSADRHGVLVVGGADANQVDAALLRLRNLLSVDVG